MSETLDPSKLKVAELREELQARGLDSKGNKATLVDRLAEALEQEGEEGGSRRRQTEHESGDHESEEDEEQENEKSGSEEQQTEDVNEDVNEDDEEQESEKCESGRDQTEHEDNHEEDVEQENEKSESGKDQTEHEDNHKNEEDEEQENEKSGGQESGKHDEEQENDEQEAEPIDEPEQDPEPESEEQLESEANIKEEPSDDGGKDGYEEHPKDGYEDAPMEEVGIKQEQDNGEREIKQEPPAEVEVKRERNDRDRHGEKRRWSDATSTRDAPDFKRQRPDVEEVRVENEPQTEKSDVVLDWYNSDMSVKIDRENYLNATPMTEHGFGYVWHGVKATFGFTQGRVYYEAIIEEEIPVPHLEAEEQHPHVLRVGWSIDEAGMVLGEEKLSYGYGGTGKASVNLKFKDYGGPFGKGDILGVYLDMESEPIRISYTINGQHKGICYEISRYELGDRALFPHIVTKNCAFKVNFGTEAPWAEPLVGYTFAGDIPIEERVLGTQGPERRIEGEIIMMIGLPAAGKTTWVNNFCRDNAFKKYNVLGTNNLIDKMKVNGLPRKRNYAGRWEVLIERCTKCLNSLLQMSYKRRRNFIIDQTNVYPSAQRRKMKGFAGFRRRAVIICPTDEDLKRRTEKREKEEGKDVPDKAVLEMKANFKLPEEGDLFDVVEFAEESRENSQKLVEKYNKEGEDAGFGQKNRSFNRDRNNDNRNRGGYMDRRGGYGNRGGGGGGGSGGGFRGGWDRDRRGGYNDRRDNRGGGGGGGWNRDRDNRGGHNRDYNRDNRGSGGRDNHRGGGGYNRDNRSSSSGGGGYNRDNRNRQSGGSNWNQNKSQNQSIETVKSNPWASSNTTMQGSGSTSSYGNYGSNQGYGSSNQSYSQSYSQPAASTTTAGYNQGYNQTQGWNQQYYQAQQGYWGQGYNYGAQQQQQPGYNAAAQGYGTQTQGYGTTGQQSYGAASSTPSTTGYGTQSSTQQSWGSYGNTYQQNQGGYRR